MKTTTSQTDIAIHASSLWEGFVYRRDSDDLFHAWDQGGVELHCQMSGLAILDAQLCNALYEAGEDSFPGVYLYEVTEGLGNAVALHLLSTGSFPSEAEWQHTLGELAHDFFEQGCAEDLHAVTVVLQQFLPGWHTASICPNPAYPMQGKVEPLRSTAP